MTTEEPLDPITLEVFHNGLRSIADETYIALMKSAFSVNIKERQDHSTCLMDSHGRTIVLAEKTQAIHLSSMQGHMRAVMEKYQLKDLAEGDILISNDPYAAWGSHLPDINFATPIFLDGEVIAFSCNIAHHADIGGMTAGSMASTMTEIYQEGLRIPVVKILERDRVVEDLLDVILLNVRIPEERRGDYFAQVAACKLGSQRLIEFARRYGVSFCRAAFDDIIARTERRMRLAISTIPSGSYRFSDLLDDDGQGTTDIEIAATVIVSGEEIEIDFTGSAPQVAGNINCPLLATEAVVCYVLVVLLDPEIPKNQGIMNAVRVKAPSGSIVNPVFPAPVAARTHTCQRVADVVMGALIPAVPDSVIAACNGANTTAILSGIDPRNGRPYLLFETYGGGCGGRPRGDGKDGIQIHVPNAANTPIEVLENAYPILVEAYGWAHDTGGAGKFRGGLGLRRVLRPMGHTCTFTGASERFRHTPWGVFGGGSGGAGRYLLLSDDGTSVWLDAKPAPMPCGPNQHIVIQSPGAGGYGNPRDRDPKRIAVDLRSGKFSESFIREQYGLSRMDLNQLPFDPNAMDYEDNSTLPA